MDDSLLIGRYAAHQRVRGFSLRTIARRTWTLNHWERHLQANNATIETATADHLEAFLTRWPSPQSRYSIRSDVHLLYKWAVRRGLISADDPTDDVPPTKVPRRAATPIPPDQVRYLLQHAPRPVDRLILLLAAYAGMRTSEVANLRGEDVDLVGRTIVVRCGKGGSDGIIPLADELAAELSRWPRRGRLVPLQGASVGDRIRTLLRRFDIDGRPHDLRHSYATQAARRTGGNLILVAQLMRHAEVATTTRYVRWHTTGHEVVSGLYDEAASGDVIATMYGAAA